MEAIYVRLIYHKHYIFHHLQLFAHDIHHRFHNVMRGNIRSLPLPEGVPVLK
jgi:hypothetical protein